MTYLTDLTTIRDNLTTELATISADPKPNYTVDGRSISWQTHRASLIAEVEKLNGMVIKAAGATETATIAMT